MEYCPEDFDKLLGRYQEKLKARAKYPEKYPKVLFDVHLMAEEDMLVEIVEATSEQLTDEIAFWMGYITLKFVPILEGQKIIQSYMKSK
jgi:hypothetical protein